MLLDIHGQHFHQSLGRRNVQRDLLDYFGELNDLALATRKKFLDWKSFSDTLETLEAENTDRQAQLELLKFQIGELEDLDVQPGEFDELSDENLSYKSRTVIVVSSGGKTTKEISDELKDISNECKINSVIFIPIGKDDFKNGKKKIIKKLNSIKD